jgi:hypothetical protein
VDHTSGFTCQSFLAEVSLRGMRHLRIKEKPLMKKPVHIALLLGTSAIDGCSIMPELMPAPNI